jgi:hypothetical protein
MLQGQDRQETDERFERILRAIIHELYAREGKGKVTLALFCLLIREANTWRSIRLLRQHTPEQFCSVFMVDAGTLLRAMFDAYVQADFIFRDPTKRADLPTAYLDFEHVERYQMVHKVPRHDNPLTDVLESSAKRPDGEKRLQQEFDRVKAQFAGTRNKWYKGDLSQLAKAAGKEAEYDTFVTSFSGCVHSSAFAVNYGPMVPEDQVLFLASTFAARVSKINVEYNQLNLGEERMILEELCKGWFDKE